MASSADMRRGSCISFILLWKVSVVESPFSTKLLTHFSFRSIFTFLRASISYSSSLHLSISFLPTNPHIFSSSLFFSSSSSSSSFSSPTLRLGWLDGISLRLEHRLWFLEWSVLLEILMSLTLIFSSMKLELWRVNVES